MCNKTQPKMGRQLWCCVKSVPVDTSSLFLYFGGFSDDFVLIYFKPVNKFLKVQSLAKARDK